MGAYLKPLPTTKEKQTTGQQGNVDQLIIDHITDTGKMMESIDRTKLKELKQLYSIAVKEGRESFEYEGHEVLTSYAKYLIEYLKDRLGNDDVNTEEANQ